MAFEFEEAGIVDLQSRMERGSLTSVRITEHYLDRIRTIDESGPTLRSVIEINSDAFADAHSADVERKARGPRGPLHGVPVLIKDNIDTADQMMTTAGSLALLGHRPQQDAAVVRRLRAAGAVVIGKANMSEWSNFRSTRSISGWSARGGQCRNPYALDRTPWGSSSGSAVAVSANLAGAALGTETDGSLVLPAAACGVVSIKPTVGVTSRSGVIPISRTQDSVGPIARTVTDAATVLGAIAGFDQLDPATYQASRYRVDDYSTSLDRGALSGARIGVIRDVFGGYGPEVDALVERAIDTMRIAGAQIVDPANIPTARDMASVGEERPVLLTEFKAGINAYLAGVDPRLGVRTLADLIAFNDAHAQVEMPYFGQELFHAAEKSGSLADVAYVRALERSQRQARGEGIDWIMERNSLDALIAPTTVPAWRIDYSVGDGVVKVSSTPAAQAGYPCLTVPAGFVDGLPVGILFTGRAFSEPRLVGLAFAYEQLTRYRTPPSFSIGPAKDRASQRESPLPQRSRGQEPRTVENGL